MKLRTVGTLTISLGLALAGCKKPNPHDNARPPDPTTDRPVYNHRFDGGETNPYFKPGEGPSEKGGEGGAEKGGKE